MVVKRIALLFIATVLLNGCATFQPTIPEGYNGPTATIRDSVNSIDQGKADFFYLSHIDGKQIEHSLIKTMSASYGKGNFLKIVLENNSVTAQEHTFTIVGRTAYAMPIRAIIGKVFEVKGDVTFSPKVNEEYVIRGRLSAEKSVVWIERTSDSKIIDKIESEGSSELGLFEK
jgi:hypothetical protein